MEDKNYALKLLKLRETGISVLGGFASLKKRMIFRALILLACGYGIYDRDSHAIFIGLAGYVLGMTVQDASWLQGMKRSWNFEKKVINWSEVERVAGKDS